MKHALTWLVAIIATLPALYAGNKTPDALAKVIPRPSEIGKDWHPVNPDRWLIVSKGKVSAFYDFRPAATDGKSKPDSVIADCFIFESEAEAEKMIKAHREKAAAVKGNVIEELPELDSSAYASFHEAEKAFGKRVTFKKGNVVITLSPSHSGQLVAKSIIAKLK